MRSNNKIIILDNFSNSNISRIRAIEKISDSSILLYEGDIRNKNLLIQIFSENDISTVIHFATLKSISESVEKPLIYHDNNILDTINLHEVMEIYNCKNIIFSSSATVYVKPEIVQIKEDAPISAINHYGQSKLFIENILQDLYKSDLNWNIVILRYFNPIGPHESGLIGESPFGILNNLLPYFTQIAIVKLPFLGVFGNDYLTKDGTGVRDYIHVVDLAIGYVAAVNVTKENKGLKIYNLGTGKGNSVLEVIETMKIITGKTIPYKFLPRRVGDVAECIADYSIAKDELKWVARHDFKKCVRMLGNGNKNFQAVFKEGIYVK